MADPRHLAPSQRRALQELSRARALEEVYLAGGAAVGLHLGHRRSLDLDLFSLEPDLDLAALERRLRKALPELTVVAKSDVTLRIRLGRVPVDVVAYPYPPLVKPRPWQSGEVRVAGLLDLAVMKLAVAAQRGLRRDYWDLYEILKTGLSIEEIGQAFLERFGHAETDLYHVARALSFFDDTERDPRFPRGLTPAKWKAIKAYLTPLGPRLLSVAPVPRGRRSHRRRRT